MPMLIRQFPARARALTLLIMALVPAMLAGCGATTPSERIGWAQPWIVADPATLIADIPPFVAPHQSTATPELDIGTEPELLNAAPYPAPAAPVDADPSENPLLTMPPMPTPAIPADAAANAPLDIDWSQPLEGWLAVDAHLAGLHRTEHSETAHGLMLLSLALNDTLHATEMAREAGLDISDEVALAGAATQVLPISRGLAGRGAGRFAVEALAGIEVSDEARFASHQLGISVAQVVLARVPAESPLIAEAGSISVAEPAQAGSEAMQAQQNALLAALPATDAERAEVLVWLGPEAPALPLRWLELAQEQAIAAELATTERAGLYAVLAIAIADSAAICTEHGTLFDVESPAAWLSESDPNWQPLLPIPAGPTGPARSACISAAAGAILAARFPTGQDLFATTAADASAAAVAAAWNWPMDIAAGTEVGTAVARQVLDAPQLDAERQQGTRSRLLLLLAVALVPNQRRNWTAASRMPLQQEAAEGGTGGDAASTIPATHEPIDRRSPEPTAWRTDAADQETYLYEIAAFVHDMRNVMQFVHTAAMKLSLVLDEHGIDDDEARLAVHTIDGATGTMERFFETMADMVNLSRGNLAQALTIEEFDLGMLTARVLREMTLQARSNGIAITSELAGPLFITGDEGRIGRVLSNLIGNAIRYTGRQQGHREIVVRAWAGEGIVSWQVQDTGIGIDPSQIARLGRRFERLGREQLVPEGLGLGLNFCMGVLAAHHGTLIVESPGEGQGTTVTITLPAAPEEKVPG